MGLRSVRRPSPTDGQSSRQGFLQGSTPASGHDLVFAGLEGEKGSKTGIGAVGQIGSDGTFELTTFDTGDGAVLGQHAVTISIQSEGGSQMKNMPSDPVESVKVAHEQNLIPPIYTDPSKTPLKYTVELGDNNFDIVLKD